MKNEKKNGETESYRDGANTVRKDLFSKANKTPD